VIEFKEVSKSFGSTVALDNVSILFPKGKIIGLFGPNGAGKSTSMKLIMGLNRCDQGEVWVDGQSPQNKKQDVAYLPEIDYLYPWMNIAQAADFIRTFYADWDEAKYRELVQYLNLREDMKISSGPKPSCS
jgi:ABC-2 type transport system ATP-binding protein